MKKVIFLSICLLIFSSLEAQSFLGIVHFKSEGVNSSPIGKSYIVSVISLKSDSSFILQHLIFANKKERKECIVLEREVQKGHWVKSADTLNCIILEPQSTVSPIVKYLFKRDKLYYFSYPVKGDIFKQRKKYPWKKVKSLNSDMFFN
jgi:hypothetical protein